MRQFARVIVGVLNNLSLSNRLLLMSLSLLSSAVLIWRPRGYHHAAPAVQESAELLPQNSEPFDYPVLDEGLDGQPDEWEQGLEPAKGNYEHLIASGDTMSTILNQYGVELNDIALLARQHPELRNLKIGQQLSWIIDQQGRLQKLAWQISPREIHSYNRSGNQFQKQPEILRGSWVQRIFSGEINDHFVASAKSSGLTSQEIQEVIKALQWQVDFRRLRRGDNFQILLTQEHLNGKSAQSQLIAAQINTHKGEYYAFRAADGCFYDAQGRGLAKGFLRLPTLTHHPISSSFNPKRCHPITGRVASHNGVDFVMPQGTPVITVGDGEVARAGYSRSAGHYVVIRHCRQYLTRYFHLQRPLVKAGQKVKQGEVIGLSGNSGSSTGPHLHFEFHINNRPVNPMGINIPSVSHLKGRERELFLARVESILPSLSRMAENAG